MYDEERFYALSNMAENQADTATAVLVLAAVRLHTDGQYSRQQAIDEVRRFKNGVED
jgi:hypothetical protein